MTYLFFVVVFGLVYKISKRSMSRANTDIVPTKRTDTSGFIEYKTERELERERKATERRELAQMDYEYCAHELARINAECKKAEQELAEETAESVRAKLERRIAVLDAKAYQLNRKKATAYNILH